MRYLRPTIKKVNNNFKPTNKSKSLNISNHTTASARISKVLATETLSMIQKQTNSTLDFHAS